GISPRAPCSFVNVMRPLLALSALLLVTSVLGAALALPPELPPVPLLPGGGGQDGLGNNTTSGSGGNHTGGNSTGGLPGGNSTGGGPGGNSTGGNQTGGNPRGNSTGGSGGNQTGGNATGNSTLYPDKTFES